MFHTGKCKTPSYILQWDGTAFTTNCPVHTDSVVNFRPLTASNGTSSFFTSANSCEKISTEWAKIMCFGEKDRHIKKKSFLSFFLSFFLFFYCIFHFLHDNADSMNDILV